MCKVLCPAAHSLVDAIIIVQSCSCHWQCRDTCRFVNVFKDLVERAVPLAPYVNGRLQEVCGWRMTDSSGQVLSRTEAYDHDIMRQRMPLATLSSKASSGLCLQSRLERAAEDGKKMIDFADVLTAVCIDVVDESVANEKLELPGEIVRASLQLPAILTACCQYCSLPTCDACLFMRRKAVSTSISTRGGAMHVEAF